MDEQTVSSVWKEIKNLLATTCAELEGAKKTLELLNPPATPAEIQKIENDIGVAFPDQLREFYLQNAGQQDQGEDEYFLSFPMANIFDVLFSLEDLPSVAKNFPWSCDEMAQNWCIESSQIASEFQIPAEFLSGDDPKVAWNSNWIPFAYSQNSGRVPFFLLVDADPPKGVKAGRIIGIGGEGDPLSLIAPDLLSLLIDIRDELKQVEPDPPAKGGKGLGKGGVSRAPYRMKLPRPRIWHSYRRGDH